MLAQGRRRAEPRSLRNGIHGLVRGLQQTLGLRQTLIEQPLTHGHSGDLPEVTCEGTQPHRGALGQCVQTVVLIQVLDHPVQHTGQAVACAGRRQGLFDVLGLTALPVRRQYHTPRHPIGDFGTPVTAQQMQTAIQPRRGASRGNHITLIDVKHLRFDDDVRVALRKQTGQLPMGGGTPSVKQAGIRQDKSPQVQADNSCATCVRESQRRQHGVRGSLGRVAPRRHDHRACLVQTLQSKRRGNKHARRAAQQAALDGTDLHVEQRRTHVRSILAENQARDRQVEQADGIKRQNSDGVLALCVLTLQGPILVNIVIRATFTKRGDGQQYRPWMARLPPAHQEATMSDTPRRALLVIDVQNGYFTGDLRIEYPPVEESLPNIGRAMDAARTADIPVVVIQHNGFGLNTRGWQLHEVVSARPHDYHIHKAWPSVFTDTDLAGWLGRHRIDTLAIVGYMTQNCNASTIFEARHRNLNVEFLSNASGAVPYANRAGHASAEEIHRVLSVVFESNFAAVLSTAEWMAAVSGGQTPQRDNIMASNQRARLAASPAPASAALGG